MLQFQDSPIVPQYLSIDGCCAKLWLYNILVGVPLSALTGSNWIMGCV